jgi:ATP-dependent DNA helicase RecG
MVSLATPLRVAVGSTAAKLGSELGLHTAGDLLGHYPRRYEQRGELTDLSRLAPGEHVTVLARIHSSTVLANRTSGSRVVVVLRDDVAHELDAVFFYGARTRGLAARLRGGRWGLFAGEVKQFRGRLSLTQPAFQLIDDDDDPDGAAERFTGLIPVYPATAGVSSWTIARAVRVVLDTVEVTEDPLPPAVRLRHGLISLASALNQIHRPGDRAEVSSARHRLKWDEALAIQVALAQSRRGARALPALPRPVRPGGLLAAFDAALAFSLTGGQRRVSAEILGEMERDAPMRRLLQGEVGSGKTVVALRAMLTAVDNGGQAALLAPTEVLATQHLRSLRALLGPLGAAGELGADEVATRVALLTGSQSAGARRDTLAAVADGSAGVVVGTHALLEQGVQFHDLALVVVDEQHRFGVEQRDALRTRGRDGLVPHLLVMTATPIPRTVAMTVFGDLETSSLAELPPGRCPVSTYLVPADRPAWQARMWQRVRELAAQGATTFVVCPRIDATEAAGAAGPGGAAVLDVAQDLAAGPLAGLRIDVLHGRQPAERKDEVMTEFSRGGLDVLVATTVVEVGVDVPHAGVMVILDADRFGISQLHQLRGRVGRGGQPGLCFLHTAAEAGSVQRERLEAVARTTDGAELAELDLRLRREGDVLGQAQSGRGRLRLLTLVHDGDLIEAARDEAVQLVEADPDLRAHPALRSAVQQLVQPEAAAFLDKV